jgi:hypothetical protein
MLTCGYPDSLRTCCFTLVRLRVWFSRLLWHWIYNPGNPATQPYPFVNGVTVQHCSSLRWDKMRRCPVRITRLPSIQGRYDSLYSPSRSDVRLYDAVSVLQGELLLIPLPPSNPSLRERSESGSRCTPVSSMLHACDHTYWGGPQYRHGTTL